MSDSTTSCPKCGVPWGEPHKSDCGQKRRRTKKYKPQRCEEIVQTDWNGKTRKWNTSFCGLPAVAIHKQVFTGETRFLCDEHAHKQRNDGAVNVVGYLTKAFNE